MTTQTAGHRFGMPIKQVSRLMLIPYGVAGKRAYAQLRGDKLHVRFGPMFDEHIALANIERAEAARWPRWAGVGPRTNFRGTVGLISYYGDAVKLTFKEPLDVHLFVVPVKCRQLYISVDDAGAFVEAIGHAPSAPHKRARAA